MNTIKIFSTIFFMVVLSLAHAQEQDSILLKVNNVPITKSEFEYAYRKDWDKGTKQNVDNFLQSYINLKLNVEEAKARGYDKKENFISEYSTYLDEIEKPYLVDSISLIKVAKAAYKRFTENIEVSRILFNIPKGYILPRDTVAAYAKAKSVRTLIGKNGSTDNFDALIRKYTEDSISKNTNYPGYMGWISVFKRPLALENAAYTTQVGAVSDPIRTDEGFSLIKVLKKRPDVGQRHLAHILLRYAEEHPSKQEKDSIFYLAQDIYKRLLAGESFEALCKKYSFDKATIPNGGDLGWFGVHRPLPESMEPKLFSLLKAGQISKPMEAEYGYHIFKLLEFRPTPSWDSVKDIIIKTVSESSYNEVLLKEKIQELAKEYPYSIHNNTNSILEKTADLYPLSDTLYFEQIIPHKKEVLLNIGKNNFTVSDFISFLDKNPSSKYTLSTDLLNSKKEEFILSKLELAKKDSLLGKYPELKNIADEFRDGILYFNIMDEEVWEKAQADKETLQKIFLRDRDKYKWKKPKYKGYVIHAKDKVTLEAVEDFINKNKHQKNLGQSLLDTFNKGDDHPISIEKGLWSKGENSFVDNKLYGTTPVKKILDYPEFTITGKVIDAPEDIGDAYGYVVEDYQKELEQNWIRQLRATYKVEIVEDVLKTVKQK